MFKLRIISKYMYKELNSKFRFNDCDTPFHFISFHFISFHFIFTYSKTGKERKPKKMTLSLGRTIWLNLQGVWGLLNRPSVKRTLV
jgi:hypothetical protein